MDRVIVDLRGPCFDRNSNLSSLQDKGSFKLKYKVDKRGKPVNSSTDENLRKYYNLEEEDDDDTEIKSDSEDSSNEEEESEEEEHELKEETDAKASSSKSTSSTVPSTKLSEGVKKLLHSTKVDYARGEGAFVEEESSDEDTSSEEEGAESEEVDHGKDDKLISLWWQIPSYLLLSCRMGRTWQGRSKNGGVHVSSSLV